MAKAKRSSKDEQEFISQENLYSASFITEKQPRNVDSSSEKGCSTQNSYDFTKRLKPWVEDFEIFCAGWGFYSPEVECLFHIVKKRIRDGAPNYEIAELIKDILDAIPRKSAILHKSFDVR